MQTILVVVHLFLALGIIGLVLIQHGKGADAGAAFGSGASATVFGARGSTSFLSHTTGILATLFFVTSLALAYYASQGNAPRKGIMEQQEPIAKTEPTDPDKSDATGDEKDSSVPAIPPATVEPSVTIKQQDTVPTVVAVPLVDTVNPDDAKNAAPVAPLPTATERPVTIVPNSQDASGTLKVIAESVPNKKPSIPETVVGNALPVKNMQVTPKQEPVVVPGSAAPINSGKTDVVAAPKAVPTAEPVVAVPVDKPVVIEQEAAVDTPSAVVKPSELLPDPLKSDTKK